MRLSADRIHRLSGSGAARSLTRLRVDLSGFSQIFNLFVSRMILQRRCIVMNGGTCAKNPNSFRLKIIAIGQCDLAESAQFSTTLHIRAEFDLNLMRDTVDIRVANAHHIVLDLNLTHRKRHIRAKSTSALTTLCN